MAQRLQADGAHDLHALGVIQIADAVCRRGVPCVEVCIENTRRLNLADVVQIVRNMAGGVDVVHADAEGVTPKRGLGNCRVDGGKQLVVAAGGERGHREIQLASLDAGMRRAKKTRCIRHGNRLADKRHFGNARFCQHLAENQRRTCVARNQKNDVGFTHKRCHFSCKIRMEVADDCYQENVALLHGVFQAFGRVVNRGKALNHRTTHFDAAGRLNVPNRGRILVVDSGYLCAAKNHISGERLSAVAGSDDDILVFHFTSLLEIF